MRTKTLNTSLPISFRQIHLELAREREHPEGATDVGYIIVAPLDRNGRIDAALWKEYRDACRVTRLRPDQTDEIGQLVHRPGGSWAIHYGSSAELPDETGYHFQQERFTPGEYVSIREGETMRTYRVSSVSPL